MDTARPSKSAQSVPAPPLGPRRPCYTRYPTAPPMGRSDTKEQIPIDKIADVLRNPGHYSELYPETLPLTRRLYQQLGTQEPTKPAPAIAPHEPVQAIEQAMGQPKERLYFQHPAMNDVDTVRPGRNAIHRDTRGYQGQQQTRSPIEQDATPTRTYSDATLSVVETDMVCDVEVVPRTQDRRQQEIGVRALTWMDILERGEWPIHGSMCTLQHHFGDV